MTIGPTSRSRAREHDSLFEPDVIFPGQLVERRNEGAKGERHLLIAVLDDAVNCFKKNLFARNNRQRRLFREAEEWIRGETDNPPFAFENVCRILDLDPEYIRRGLGQWRDQQVALQWREQSPERQELRGRRVRSSVQRATRMSTRALT